MLAAGTAAAGSGHRGAPAAPAAACSGSAGTGLIKQSAVRRKISTLELSAQYLSATETVLYTPARETALG